MSSHHHHTSIPSALHCPTFPASRVLIVLPPSSCRHSAWWCDQVFDVVAAVGCDGRGEARW
ncbi:adhesion G protein-coupled receptor L1-like [Sesbania bispinosa]|nr:adhesion G protein-coupled receptor L1-like [Sesbania bispinosa]